ncbi:MAG: tetratricopeptide repeat protein [Candidatus Krumholzibacteriota bacterium]|nr:tetratricopeptide repeat protein [Candidatus Krumholzibacteriota bacterium]
MTHNKLTKHELKDDAFVTFVLDAREYIRENQNKIFIGLIALVVLIAGSLWMNNSRIQAREEAKAHFSEALSSFRNGQIQSAEELFRLTEERFGKLQEGAYSAYFIGQCALIDGRNAEAIEAFENYLDRAGKFPFFKKAAMDGMATAFGNDRNYDRAAEIYIDLIAEIKDDSFMENLYLKKGAEMCRLSNRNDQAIEMLERLLEKTTGVERRDIQIELDILRG